MERSRKRAGWSALWISVVFGTAAISGGVEGVWLVGDEDAHVEVGTCGESLCGKVVWLRDPLDEQGNVRRDTKNKDEGLRDKEILGMALLRGVRREPDPKGVWRGGKVYDPKTGKTYHCSLRLDGDSRLVLRGYIGIPLFGRTTSWTRVVPEAP